MGKTATEDLRIAWLSGAFGYAGDLMYFDRIFAELHRRFPNAVIPVDASFPVQRYPHLPLRPILTFHVIGQVRRSVGSIAYTSMRRVPTLGSLARLRRLRLDVLIITEFSFTALAGFALARLTRTPIALLVESDPSFRGAPTSKLALRLKRFVTRRVDAILVSNEAGRAYLVDQVGAPAEKIEVGPYLTSDPAAVEGPTPERDDRLGFLFVNSINARKGLRELIEALARTPAELRGQWRLDIVGDGPERPALESLAAERGLADNCVFHGKAAYRDIGGYYRAADVVVCPTLADYRSLGGFEAVNAGKPVLTSIYDGASREISQHFPAAHLIDPKDTAGLADLLTRFIADPAFRREQQAAAAQPVARYQVAAVGENLSRLVQRARARRFGAGEQGVPGKRVTPANG